MPTAIGLPVLLEIVAASWAWELMTGVRPGRACTIRALVAFSDFLFHRHSSPGPECGRYNWSIRIYARYRSDPHADGRRWPRPSSAATSRTASGSRRSSATCSPASSSGPNTPGFVANKHLADQLAEVGVILLMFGVGLQFHLKELLAVRRVAVPGALGQSLVATLLGTLVGVAFGWGWSAGIVFGMAISVASTVVLMRVLADNSDLHTPAGHIAVGWLVVEDLFTVLVLVLLPAVFGPGGAGAGGVAVGRRARRGQARRAGRPDVPRRGAAHPLAAGPRGRDPLARAVHADGARAWRSASRWGRPSSSASRWPSARSSPGWSSGGRNSASGRRPRRCRCGTPSPSCSSSRSGCCSTRGTWSSPGARRGDPGRRPARQAAGRPRHRPAARLPAPGRPLGRRRPRPDRRVLVHPRHGREEPRRPRRRGHQHPDRRRHHLDHPEPDPLPADRSPRVGSSSGSSRTPAPSGVPARSTEADERADSGRHRAVIVGYGPVGRTLARLLRENEFEPVVIELNMDTVREVDLRRRPGRLRRRDASRDARAGRPRGCGRPGPEQLEHARQRAS